MQIQERTRSIVTTERVTLSISDTEIKKAIIDLVLAKYSSYAVSYYDEEISQDCFKGVSIQLEKVSMSTSP